MFVSIITPTYNRGYILSQCYESLKKQTCKDFEWIIVDDGSTDNTEQVVKSFIEENNVCLSYIRQENGGKHRAHNTAVKEAKGTLTVCVDSDDALAPNAIERIVYEWSNVKIKDNVIGILALRGDFKSHKPICSKIPERLSYCTMSDLRDLYGFKGDTVLFFKTDLLKNNLFKEFPGEKFLSENHLYCDLDTKGKMLLLDEVLYYCHYLPDGLTAKYHKLLKNNPKGSADTYYKMCLTSKSLWLSFKYAIIAQAYRSLVIDTSDFKWENRRCLTIFARLFVPLFKIKYLNKIDR